MRCVELVERTRLARPALLAALAVAIAATASPAEARRRKAPAAGGYNPPYAAMVVDVKTGRTLHAVNEDALRHPASVTKVMTLYLLFEQLERGRMSLDTPLTVSANASRQAPSKLGLRPGSTIDVEDAIGAIVTKSANDVACVIAENIGGSEEGFAEMMTRKAHALGMSRTHYANASGLPDPDQVTTARDLTILARAIQDRFPKYFRYFQTRSFHFAGRTIGNHNRLVGSVEGVDGIKTGYTRASGFNLMTSAKLNGRQIVGIVLGGKSGASRDRIMADLVRSNLPRAYAGDRTSSPVIEVAERPRPAVVAEAPRQTSTGRTLVASADPDAMPATTASVNRTGAPLEIVPRTTTTPSATTPSAKWSAGAGAAVPASAQAFAAMPNANGKYDGRIPAVEAASLVTREPVREAKSEAPRAGIALPPRPATVSPWVIQLGAMDDEDKAKSMLVDARARGGLGRAAPFTEKVVHGGTTLFRARFSGFSEAEDAQDACRALKRNGFTCFATRS
jgi:D-alanyl-D-alanine carboxypeptidase